MSSSALEQHPQRSPEACQQLTLLDELGAESPCLQMTPR